MAGCRYLQLFVVWCCITLLGPALSGCSKKEEVQENKAADHLRKIALAFEMAQYSGKAPKSADVIKPFLKELSPNEDPDDILRSPNDGEPYVVMWGVNLERQTDFNAIFAHEKKGTDGKRYVINVTRIVLQMSDADFAAASFAKAKK